MVTNGMIRASCRKLSEQSPWTEMGLPYHRCYDVDAEELIPGEPVELVFDCYPTSWLFREGNRIRVTITGSNAPIYPAYMDGAEISMYHDKDHASCITLPVIP
jgi:predicted acyl esterase